MSSSWANPLFVNATKGGRRAFFGIIQDLENGQLVVPHYQRSRVWTEDQKARWVGYVLSQAPLPGVFVREVNVDEGFRDEIVDGQQRLLAIWDWRRGRVPALIPWSGETVWCRTDLDRRMITRLAIPYSTLPPGTSDEEAIRLYLTLNTEGTPHTPEELDRVRGLLGERT